MRFFLFLFFASFLYACSSEPKSPFSNTPEIAFVSISPDTVKELNDSIIITISYKDGDGDLGENTADQKNLFLNDTRIDVTEQYRISQLVPNIAQVPIQGKIKIRVDGTVMSSSDSSLKAESLLYTIKVKDRAGNFSNLLYTKAITIIRNTAKDSI